MRPEGAKQHSVRLRTQCQALEPSAQIETPRKPYLLKSLLMDGWGGQDGRFVVSDKPVWLEETNEHLALTESAIFGEATADLPIVYVSTRSGSSRDLSDDRIERLAYRLGGVAHILVEPSRAFSFDLKNVAEGKNAYGGAIGIYSPVLGLTGRYFIDWDLADPDALSERVEDAVIALRTRMPVRGWDWSELQERSLRSLRSGPHEEIEFKELEKIYLEEIDALTEQVSDLKGTIDDQNEMIVNNEKSKSNRTNDPFNNLFNLVGREIYSGEVADRLRLAAKVALSQKGTGAIDERSAEIFSTFISKVQRSEEGSAFVDQLKNCTSSNDKLSSALIPFLSSHGFNKKSENKHIRMEPEASLKGIGSATIPKSPSDHRTAKNMRSQLMQLLGLRSIDF